jgi:hypothetical protein
VSLPEGVTAATLTAKVTRTNPPSPILISASIAPSLDLTHAASGVKLTDMIETLITSPNISEFAVPHSSQAGFVDEFGTPVSRWYYIATVTSRAPGGSLAYAPRTRAFQLPAGITEVELETLPIYRPSPADVPPTPEVEEPFPATVPGTMVYRGVYEDSYHQLSLVNFDSGEVPTTGWTFDRPPAIVVQPDDARGTGFALQLADIDDEETTYATVSVTIPEGPDALLYVRYYLESEDGYDYFTMYFEGEPPPNAPHFVDSGIRSGFREGIIPITPGTHSIRLDYTKDDSGSEGFDGVIIGSIGYYQPFDAYVVPYALGHVVLFEDAFWISQIDGAPHSPEVESPFWRPLAPGTP